jgi:putative SOS response-associated peptidase YedK
MKDDSPFGIGGLWENWKEPASGDWIRTFAIITTDANELVADIHDRMPLILAPGDYARWLSEEPDPRELMRPFPASPLRTWPISSRVNKPENDDPSSSQSNWPQLLPRPPQVKLCVQLPPNCAPDVALWLPPERLLAPA